MTTTCHYCSQAGDLRPYGPGGTWVCHPCITDPAHAERNKLAVEAFLTQLAAAEAMSPIGAVIIDADTESGPEPLLPEDFGQ